MTVCANRPPSFAFLFVARGIFHLLMLYAIASFAPASGAVVKIDPALAPNRLVILGASYAESWGEPPLPGFMVVNRGVGGEQTKGMRARFQSDVIANQPKVVLIWGHINNITQTGVSDTTRLADAKAGAMDDYRWMLRQARANGIEVMLATEIPLAEPSGMLDRVVAFVNCLRGKQSYAEQVNHEVRELNAFVRQLAAREQLALLDFEKVFAPNGGSRKPEYALEDRSHVTPAGYHALAVYTATEMGKRR